MSSPAKPLNPNALQKSINKQSWLILALLVIGSAIDLFNQQPNYIITKNLLAGSVLSWIGQLIFAKVSLSVSGYRQRRQIVNRFYQAHMLKWLITLIGFGFIFIFLRPLAALWVFLGYFVLQISYIIITYKYKT